jgi:GR25 family glycosyltransferase involved in LPS biosynthesis
MYKLFNFPSTNIITIEESKDRLNFLLQNFSEYNVKNITVHTYKKYEYGDHDINSNYISIMGLGHIGAITSHLKTIKKWYNTTNEKYSLFCEDDLSLETVQYWKFDWSSFFYALPKYWGCVQLVLIKDHDFFDYDKSFKKRDWDNWSGCCYILTRSFAKKIIDIYHKDHSFNFDYNGLDEHRRKIYNTNDNWLIPTTETIVFSLLEPVYTVPLFVENINFESTLKIFNSNDVTHSLGHIKSYNEIIDWWKNGGLNLYDIKNVDTTFI